MRGKKWVLLPHVVEVVGDKAKANLFEVPEGYALPVTFGGKERTVKVVLRGLPRPTGAKQFLAKVIHPGEEDWKTLEVIDLSDTMLIEVPLTRGCAMVKLICLDEPIIEGSR